MLLVFSVACDGTPAPPPPPPPAPIPTPGPDYERFLKDFVPKDWQEVNPQEVTAGEDPLDREWIVFYRVGDPSENPIDAVMYRPILDGPPTLSDKAPSFVAYDLHSPYEEHMCVCECRAERADLLSVYGGSELIISDECEGKTTRLLAYRWVTDPLKYELLAYFDGDRVYMDLDRVTVDNYTPGGADLVFRCTYSPREGATYFNEEESFSEGECVFTNGLPDDVFTSPYPEMIVLALYSQIQCTDTTKIQGYFADDVWESMGHCEAGQCGCPAKSSPIARVRVTSMEIAESRQVMDCVDRNCPPDPVIAAAEDHAVVTAEAVCEYEDGSRDPVSATWILTWTGDGWRLTAMTTQEGIEETVP